MENNLEQLEQNKFAEVIVDISSSNVDKIFDYKLNLDIPVGSRVLVPFGPRQIEGYIINIKDSSSIENNKLKEVISAVDDFALIKKEHIELMKLMQQKYHLKYIDILKLFLPSELRNGHVKSLTQCIISLNENVVFEYEKNVRKNAKNILGLIEYLKQKPQEFKNVLTEKFSAQSVKKLIYDNVVISESVEKLRVPYSQKIADKKVVWTPEQQRAINEICEFENKTYLLHGVTGSGKTEVYMGAISQVLEKGKTAILLVPEISLTPQVLSSLRARFGSEVAILHSGLSQGERFDEWKRITNKQAKVVVGARSAIFAPLTNVGIIIIDEEHDSSYFSESNPRFSTHIVAKFRSVYNSCPLVLGSATPSIETYYKTTTGEYNLLSLPKRVNGKKMPKIQVVDMIGQLKLGNSGIFSSYALNELQKTIDNKKQAMLFLNRRGYSSFMMCRECGYVAKCSDCDVSLVFHRGENVLKCHYCNKRFKPLTKCPVCKSESIRQGAIGTERVLEEIKNTFPNVPVFRMDNDTTKTKNAHGTILSEFSKTKPAILIGTQMIAKGHDFPDVTFVCIVDGDQSLYHTDYKSAERTFALITQMSGRAGRDEDEGISILQTYSPKHYVYRFASNYDFEGFYKKEINLRQTTHFPPFSQIIRLLFSSENDTLVKEVLKECYTKIANELNQFKADIYYLDAMASPINRIQKKHRYQILIRFNTILENEVTKILYDICDKNQNAKVSIFVEINPQNLS